MKKGIITDIVVLVALFILLAVSATVAILTFVASFYCKDPQLGSSLFICSGIWFLVMFKAAETGARIGGD